MDITENKKTKENEIVSFQRIGNELLYKVLGIVWLFVFSGAIWCTFNFEKIIKISGLDKTVFAFIAGIFISALVFTDSLLKTYKYNTRATESVAGNIMQTVALVAMGAWAYFTK